MPPDEIRYAGTPFRNSEEEADYWYEHQDDDSLFGTPLPSPADNLPKDRSLTIRFTEPTLRMLKYAAHRRGLSVGALARMWLLEKLADDVEPAG
ncbi:MAG TPA: hypothetical protein VNK95_21890 [Caldilineaceae bacterium]|nr:hypothetical protein [Caldilineaceae bacterium]